MGLNCPTALQNAASIAALMLTTEALVTEMDEKEKPVRVVGAAWAVWITKPYHSKLSSESDPDFRGRKSNKTGETRFFRGDRNLVPFSSRSIS
jgi:hypothetical protein